MTLYWKMVSSEIKVYTSPIKEPYELVNRLMFWKKRSFKQGVVSEKSKSSPLERLITWARGNLFVPDPKTLMGSTVRSNHKADHRKGTGLCYHHNRASTQHAPYWTESEVPCKCSVVG